MNAMIFAAGLGTRLKPYTDHCPKALVRVGDKPMLEHLILKLKAAGFTHLVVNVYHFADQIIEFLASNQNFGLDIQISDERGQLLETGGGIKKAAPLFVEPGPILIHNVDIFSDADLSALYRSHIINNARAGALATLLVNERCTSRYFLLDDAQRLRGWKNITTGQLKPAGFDADLASTLHMKAFAGIHVVSQELFPLMESWTGAFSITDFYLQVAQQAVIMGHEAPQSMRWVDAGKPESLLLAQQIVDVQ